MFAGILEKSYVQEVLNDDYFAYITEEMNTTWKNEHGGKSVKEFLDDYLVEYFGKPMIQLQRYNFISSTKPHRYKGELSLNGTSLRIVISILTDIWSMTITAIAYQVTCPAD